VGEVGVGDVLVERVVDGVPPLRSVSGGMKGIPQGLKRMLKGTHGQAYLSG